MKNGQKKYWITGGIIVVLAAAAVLVWVFCFQEKGDPTLVLEFAKKRGEGVSATLWSDISIGGKYVFVHGVQEKPIDNPDTLVTWGGSNGIAKGSQQLSGVYNFDIKVRHEIQKVKVTYNGERKLDVAEGRGWKLYIKRIPRSKQLSAQTGSVKSAASGAAGSVRVKTLEK